MRLSVFGIALVSACGSGGTTYGPGDLSTSSSSSSGAGEPANLQGMVAAHNVVRHGATPAPSPALPDLTWSVDAASVAQGWADHLATACGGISHNPGRGDYGENIAWFSNTSATVQDVVDAWAGEASCYQYASNTCTCAQCGHYTQIVWRDTTQVGCARATCASGAYWVCDYAPPGNWVGNRPY